MNYIKYIIILLVVPIFSQFGKNIVQYSTFDWHYIQTEYFDIYYYDTQVNADYVAAESKNAYNRISKAIGWELTNRIPIIIYNSHNDFQQTNVIDMYMPEGVGGVTELYKNRVVIPYDAEHKKFKDVLNHELVHAFINDYLYKGNAINMQDQNIKPIPLWMNEGLAEFLTESWSTESDMWIRDLVINGEQLPTFNQLNGYLAYRGGQSIWKFIIEVLDVSYLTKETNAPTIIASIFRSISNGGDLNEAFKNNINLNLEELEEEWQKYLKKQYWVDINDRDYIEDIATPLFNQKKINANYSIAPSVSPDGLSLAFYSNHDGVMSLYIIPADCQQCEKKSFKKLLKGEMSTEFEELHILRPGITWNPKSTKVMVAVKSRSEDAIFIINTKNNKKEKLTFSEYGIKAIFQPSWHPVDKDLIAFIGSDNIQSDIYTYNLNNNNLVNVTDDIFTDKDIEWSHNGKNIIFSSDRGSYLNSNQTKNTKKWGIQFDLYSVTINDKNNNIIRLTDTVYDESYPQPMENDSIIAYISDQNGINNIYLLNSFNKKEIPASNVLTGITQLEVSNNNLFFTGFEKSIFSLYRLDSLKIDWSSKDKLSIANWKEKYINYDYSLLSSQVEEKNNYNNYIFKKNSFTNPSANKLDNKNKIIERDSTGNYIGQEYKTRFTMDIGQMYYGFGLNGNDYGGGNGMAQFLFSDILGDHKIYIGTALSVNLKRSDYSFAYRYLPNLLDWTFLLFHDASEFMNDEYYGDEDTEEIILIQNFKSTINASFPVSKFNRFDFEMSYYLFTEHLDIYKYNNGYYDLDRSEFIKQDYISTIDFKYVWDNTRFFYTYPIDGKRFYLKYKNAPFNNFQSATFDGRVYKNIGNGISFMCRNFTGFSWGSDNQSFYLGSAPLISNSNNYNVNQYYNNQNLEEYYTSEHVVPIRGVPFMYKKGDNAVMFNFEMRAPFLLYYFPTIKWLGQINGIIFMDVGAAWNKDSKIPKITDSYSWLDRESGGSEQGWVMSFGWGPRLILFGLPIQLNYAWQYNPISGKQSSRRYEVTMGFDL
tara:strand:- start:1675 stop:4803 length:3129 start_codon:yes stop_codon:yes gene_type:complete